MQYLYFALSAIGAIVPYIFFTQHFAAEGTALADFIAGVFANGASSGFGADVLISSAVFWIYLWNQRARHLWLYVLLNLLIGLSCALPLYLAMASRQKTLAPA